MVENGIGDKITLRELNSKIIELSQKYNGIKKNFVDVNDRLEKLENRLDDIEEKITNSEKIKLIREIKHIKDYLQDRELGYNPKF